MLPARPAAESTAGRLSRCLGVVSRDGAIAAIHPALIRAELAAGPAGRLSKVIKSHQCRARVGRNELKNM
jgi:hypothetical protein